MKIPTRAAVLVWEGDFGVYPIPEELRNTKFTKSGWPDRRSKTYEPFMAWASAKDAERRMKYGS